MQYVDGGGRVGYATTEAKICKLRLGTVPFCTFSITEDEKLSRRETLGLWIRLVPIGWRVTWDDQWVLTEVGNEEQTTGRPANE